VPRPLALTCTNVERCSTSLLCRRQPQYALGSAAPNLGVGATGHKRLNVPYGTQRFDTRFRRYPLCSPPGRTVPRRPAALTTMQTVGEGAFIPATDAGVTRASPRRPVASVWSHSVSVCSRSASPSTRVWVS